MIAIVLGSILAIAAVYLVLQPLMRRAAGKAIIAAEPLFSDSDDEDDPLLARRDRALAALKEIDFDRATGKLSDEDYEKLKAEFTGEALEALRAVDAAEADPVEALIAASALSAAGRRFCLECGSPLEGAQFCLECGTPIGATPG